MEDNRRIIRKGNILPNGKSQSGEVYGENGLSPTLCGMDKAKSIVKILEEPTIKLRETTSKGYTEAKVGDGIEIARKTCNVRRGVVHSDSTGALNTTEGGWGTLTKDYRIRRLTPRECERLQGFPDDWTRYGKDGETISDTQRYKCCGNAVTTTVITAIVDQMFQEEE